MPLAPLGFLGVKKVNEVPVPVVQYLVSQRAGSIRALVTYFVVPRALRYFPSDIPIPSAGAIRPTGTRCSADVLALEVAIQTGIVSYCFAE
jgi:hypothetical protein